MAGVKLTLPEEFSNPDFGSRLKRAPEVGEWFVITTESRYFQEPTEQRKFQVVIGSNQLVKDKFKISGAAEPFKHR